MSDAETYASRVADIQAAWRDRLGRVRNDSAASRLVDALPGAPVITVRSAAALTGRSEQAVNEAIPRLLEAGVLKQTTVERLVGRVGVGDLKGRKDVYMCHSLCELGSEPAVVQLRLFTDFLKRNPGEIVVMYVEPYVSAAQIAKVFRRQAC